MYNLFCPKCIVDSLFDIDLNQLKALGIRGFILDLDNTIIPWDSKEMSLEITAWIQMLKTEGFQICIVSNNYDKRVKAIAALFAIPYISRAYKPLKGGFRHGLEVMDLNPKEVAVIGDQMFTDMLGGNRLGLYTIWVKPLNAKEFFGTRISRQFEKIVVYLLKTKGFIK